MGYTAARAVTCMAALLFGSSAIAADLYTPVAPEAAVTVTENGWTFSVVPYFWAAGLSGDVAQFGLPEAHVDASFGDIFDHLDFGAMAIGEARYGRYSIFGDIIYTKISGSAGTPRGILASSVSVTTETFAGLLGAGYSVISNSSGRLDVVGGVRVWSVGTDLSFSGGVLDGVSRSDGATWLDAMGGLRGNYSITPKVYCNWCGHPIFFPRAHTRMIPVVS